MIQFVELRFAPNALARHQLPDIGYPVPADHMDAILHGGGDLPFPMLLFWLQERSRQNPTGWRADEPALDRIATLMAPPDRRSILSAAGENWWLEIGPVDLDGPIVAIQREGELVAALSRRADGRLRGTAYRPLDGKCASYLIGLSQVPSPTYGVAMRENNWEYAKDCAAGTGNSYAALRGEPYCSLWPLGIGRYQAGKPDQVWLEKTDSACRRAAVVATELGIHHRYR